MQITLLLALKSVWSILHLAMAGVCLCACMSACKCTHLNNVQNLYIVSRFYVLKEHAQNSHQEIFDMSLNCKMYVQTFESMAYEKGFK